jgi:hypothetical protein
VPRSIHQIANGFPDKKSFDRSEKRRQSWYKFALSAVSSRSESLNDLLSLPEWAVVVFGSRSEEYSRDVPNYVTEMNRGLHA